MNNRKGIIGGEFMGNDNSALVPGDANRERLAQKLAKSSFGRYLHEVLRERAY